MAKSAYAKNGSEFEKTVGLLAAAASYAHFAGAAKAGEPLVS